MKKIIHLVIFNIVLIIIISCNEKQEQSRNFHDYVIEIKNSNLQEQFRGISLVPLRGGGFFNIFFQDNSNNSIRINEYYELLTIQGSQDSLRMLVIKSLLETCKKYDIVLLGNNKDDNVLTLWFSLDKFKPETVPQYIDTTNHLKEGLKLGVLYVYYGGLTADFSTSVSYYRSIKVEKNIAFSSIYRYYSIFY